MNESELKKRKVEEIAFERLVKDESLSIEDFEKLADELADYVEKKCRRTQNRFPITQ